ncbi:MAG: M20/M25/M40 family metallo-hydrolase [Thermoleophilaceae bacterium]
MRATQAERERLRADFVRLCEIPSPSRRERPVADYVVAEIGLELTEDGSSSETGADAGNLLGRIPGPAGAPTVLFCAHLDTVPLTGPIEVEEVEGRYTNRFDAILGADNKAAVAAFMGVARRFAGDPPVGLEFLFTTCEEVALQGAKAFDRGQLRADFGFVFDHASPIGELIVAAPSYFRIEAEFHGRAAHAGIRPEDGRSAIVAAANALARMELGRIDDETTANVGRVEGGTAANVVAERCRLELEARSVDPDKASRTVERMVDALTDAASDAECDVETHVQEQFRAYRIPRTTPPVTTAATALEQLGIEPQYVTTGGGSDANVFNAEGLSCLNVANGTAHNHEPDEFVTVEALEGALDLALTLVECSGSR